MSRVIFHVVNSQAERVAVAEGIYNHSLDMWTYYPYSILSLLREDIPIEGFAWVETVGDLNRLVKPPMMRND